MSRVSDLQALAELKGKASDLASQLNIHPWDSDTHLIALSPAHFRQVLKRFAEGSLQAEEVELWANTLECREDVGFSSAHQEVCRAVLHELANPSITESLSPASVRRLLALLPNER